MSFTKLEQHQEFQVECIQTITVVLLEYVLAVSVYNQVLIYAPTEMRITMLPLGLISGAVLL